MITEIVIIYLLVNSLFIWLIPQIGGRMVSGREYRDFSDFDEFEVFIIMFFGVAIFIFAFLPIVIIGGDEYF